MEGKTIITDLEYEATHSGASRQHQENVREEHEITFTLLLSKTSSINSRMEMDIDAELVQKCH